VLKPLLQGLGAFALVGVLMLGGWALTSATPQVPRHAPAAGSAVERSAGPEGGHAPPAAADDRTRARPAALRAAVAQARDVPLAPAAPGVSLSSVAAPGAGAARRSGAPPPLRREPYQDAEARRRADAARQLADRRRAEQLLQAELARQSAAAKRAEEAGRVADRAQEDAGGDE
jgi:hypothetical protein